MVCERYRDGTEKLANSNGRSVEDDTRLNGSITRTARTFFTEAVDRGMDVPGVDDDVDGPSWDYISTREEINDGDISHSAISPP